MEPARALPYRRPLRAGLSLLLAGLGAAAQAAFQGPAKPPRKAEPTDAVKQHVQNIARSSASYRIPFRGSVDGVMTRSPVGYGAYSQGFQPNVRVRLENLGESDVVNPCLLVNGRRNWRTAADIAAEATRGFKTDREKAMALWYFQVNHRFHACTWDGEVDDPVKALNVYGYTLCGDEAQVLADLARTAGLKTRRGYPVGHCVTEIFFDGAYHLLDTDEAVFCLLRDNETVAAEEQVVRDHDLMKRTHTYGILNGASRQTDEFSVSLYGYEGKREGEHASHIRHKMDLTLRPGEWLEWRWDHVGKQYTAGVTMAPGQKWMKDGEGDLLSGWGATAYGNMCNGRMGYAPALRSPVATRGVAAQEGAAWDTNPAAPALHPAAVGRPAEVTWAIRSPYVVVGGKVTLTYRRAPGGSLRLEVSPDGQAWQSVWSAAEPAGEAAVVLDEHLSPPKKPHYQYLVRLNLAAGQAPADTGIAAIAFDTDVQMSALHLPELEVGTNRVTYRDETKGERQVRITHEWIERTTARPPGAPAGPLFPRKNATVDGTRFAFTWQPPAGAAKVADYQFQLSGRRDMAWPLSPTFDRLVGRTPDKGKAQWTIPYTGLLNPAQTYYWRVRAQSAEGLWGPWSPVWSFRCRAPGVPLAVSAHADPAAGTVRLTWEANPKGTRPAKCKVYASDEQGFTASDADYTRYLGRGFLASMPEYESRKDLGMVKAPANLVGETTACEMMVAGPEVTLPNANRPFYRVVAVDAQGLESGPSDMAEAPRPFLVTRPPTTARAGEAYRYMPAALASLGHLTCRTSYTPGFWHKETLTFSLPQAPEWLKVDAATGEVSGTPPAVGEVPVTLRVVNSRRQQAEQQWRLVVR